MKETKTENGARKPAAAAKKPAGAVLEVTTSGAPKNATMNPYGEVYWLQKYESAWAERRKPARFKINAAQIEKFHSVEFPVVTVQFTKKNVSKLYEWFWSDHCWTKVYDVEEVKTGVKKATFLKTASGETMYVDEPEDKIAAAVEAACGKAV